MGLYLFQNPLTEEIVEIFQNMSDEHIYEKDGIKYNRIFTIPQTSIDSQKVNPFDSNSFIERTKNKKGTIGNLQDYSKELSLKREQILGKDPLKEKYYENYSKTRGGKKIHPKQKREKLQEKLKGNKFIELA
jgi:hypothetical protein